MHSIYGKIQTVPWGWIMRASLCDEYSDRTGCPANQLGFGSQSESATETVSVSAPGSSAGSGQDRERFVGSLFTGHGSQLTVIGTQNPAHRTLLTELCSQNPAYRTLLTELCLQNSAYRTLSAVSVTDHRLLLLSLTLPTTDSLLVSC